MQIKPKIMRFRMLCSKGQPTAHINRVGIRGLIPRRVESPNSAGEVSLAVESWLYVGRIL